MMQFYRVVNGRGATCEASSIERNACTNQKEKDSRFAEEADQVVEGVKAT